MTDTVNLALPCIEGSQAQKHVTHNDALRILDTLVQLAVLDRDLTAPPGAPSEGQRWIVKTTATGAWAGHDNAIAAWQDGAWQFSTPRTGWSTFVVDEGTLLLWNGTAWGDFFSTVTSIQNLALLGVGTTGDASNPLSAKLNNALFVAKTVAEGGDGHLRYKLSKESAAKTLSFLLQDNFSGRAEIGLIGDDDFHFKVSPDGSTWVEALKLDKTTGAATLASSLSASALLPAGSSIPTNGIYLPSANTIGIAANSTQIWSGSASTIAVKPTTASTSTTTGALTVAGGLGVAGSLNVGAPSNIYGAIYIPKLSSVAATYIGDLIFNTTTSLNGIAITAHSNGNNYVDMKSWTAGTTSFRCGAGAELGSERAWATLDHATGNLSLGGKLNTKASTANRAGLNVSSGSAPTSPTSGDLWYDGTNLKFRDGGTTRTITWV